jgi:FkbM family methyltransferase
MVGSVFLFLMLRKKWTTARDLWREGGLGRICEYWWVRLQVMAKEHRPTVRLDGCTFRLEGITEGATVIALVTNQYELAERKAITQYLRRSLPVIELGGSMGVVSCVTNKLLKRDTAHVVVEANPLAIPHLEHNRKLNRCNFEIVNKAIAYGVDSVTYRPSSSLLGNSITSEGDSPAVTVRATQLEDLVREHGFGPFNLICDIEGLEFDLIRHESVVLGKVDTLIMETHARFIGADKCREMTDRLKEIGFRMVKEIDFVIVMQQSRAN